MKKILLIIAASLTMLTANAQDVPDASDKILMHKLIDIPTGIFLIYLATTFLLTMLKLILDNRLKYKMIEKDLSEDLIKQVLQANDKDIQNEALKWFILFAGTGIGLIISWFFPPFGIHTLAIMAFSVASSFFVYYNILKRSRKQ